MYFHRPNVGAELGSVLCPFGSSKLDPYTIQTSDRRVAVLVGANANHIVHG